MPTLTHPAITVADLRRLGLRLLSEAGIANARQEVVWLLERALETTGLRLQLDGDKAVSARARERALALLARRAQGEPLQYLLGSQDFCGLDFQVGPEVLIPRPETELLVEEAVKRLSGAPPLVADVGTGSGCLAVALAHALPAARVYATDVSAAALAVARRNAARHGVTGRVTFFEGDLLAPLPQAELLGRLAAVISNPPYIKDGEMAGLQREVTREPWMALAAGPDGLHFYRRFVQEAGDWLEPQGFLLVEVGQGQAGEVAALARGRGWDVRQTVRDAAGIERVVCLQKR